MLCPNCGNAAPPDARFCPACGQTLEQTCIECGRKLISEATFCHGCGTRVSTATVPATPPTDPLPQRVPTSFKDGRYLVQRFLGEGSRKRVYAVHDTFLDREVAFALVKTEGLDQTGNQRMSQEARAMGRLADHPNVVQIYDVGDEAGQPYLVLPLMAGGGLRELLEDAPDHRLTIERTLVIAADVCRGLAWAHSRGLVHRDLKPANVWLSSDGTARIGDFGLALATDRARLAQESAMVGTALYMPPEAALGGSVDQRSDLYSLGAMLYEMVSGRPPFLGDDPVAVISQHLNALPVALTWHTPTCPKPLEALILSLLAKDPSARPDSADDVLASLEAIDTTEDEPPPSTSPGKGEPQAGTLSTGDDGAVDDAHVLDGLAGGVFVGRHHEMVELKAALDGALSGRGQLVMLVGEPGIGKTHTAQELATYASLQGAQVLWGHCYEEEGMPPYWPWVQAIRTYLRERDPEQLQAEMGTGAGDIAQIVPEVREHLAGPVPIPSQDEPAEARFRMFDAITTMFKAASLAQPIIVILDDLQWADKPSLLLLEAVARELAGARLLILGMYRDMELSRQHPLAETLSGLSRATTWGGFQRIALRGLSHEDVGRFIEVTSGIHPPEGLVSAVYRRTEGNPLFLTEVVRLLAQEGQLGPKNGTGIDPRSEGIPEGVREAIGRRLNRLSVGCNQVLALASVAGREFDLQAVGLLVPDLTQVRLMEAAEEALAARLLEEDLQAVGRYRFTHALVQETLLAEMTTARRARLHCDIAQALETFYGERANDNAAELAHHYAEAAGFADADKLVRYSLVAGERALETHAYEQAIAYFRRGLAAKGGIQTDPVAALDGETAALYFGLGQSQSYTVGSQDRQEAVTNLSRALDYYVNVKDVPSAVAVAVHPIPPSPEVIELSPNLLRALDIVPADSHDAALILARYGWILGLATGDYAGAQEALAKALAIAEREGDGSLQMRILAYTSRIHSYNDRWEDSLETSLRAIELARHIDNLRAEADAQYRAAYAYQVLGELQRAQGCASRVLSLAEQLYGPYWLVSALWINEILARLQGDWLAAVGFSDRGLAIWPRESRLLATRTLLEYELGSIDSANEYLNRLLEAMDLATPGPAMEYATVAYVLPMVARITGDDSYLEVAEKAAATVLSSPAATSGMSNDVRGGLGLLAVQKGDRAGAGDIYAALQVGRGRLLFASISGDRLLGLLAVASGDLDQGVTHFEDAEGFCRIAGYQPELAWTRCDYADALLARAGIVHGSTGSTRADGEQDRAKAIALLDESLAISTELGMRPLMERVLTRKLELQGVASVDLSTSIDAVASAISIEQPDLRPHAAPDGTVTILFSDIEGSTQMTERLGDHRMQQLLRGHNDIVRHQLFAYGGFEVKSLGDGFMLAFSSARRGLQCAVAIQRAFAAHNQEHPEELVRVRIGLHTGEFVQELEDFFGKNVILASRIADQAQGGQILISALLKELTESAGDIKFGEAREVELKGLTGLNRVYPVVWDET